MQTCITHCIELSHVDDIVWIFSFDILCTHVDILLFSYSLYVCWCFFSRAQRKEIESESSRIILWPLLTLCFKPKPSRRSRKFSSTVLPFDLSGWPMQPAYHQRAARSVAPAGAKQQNSYQFLSMSSLLPTQNSYHHEFIAPHHHLYTPLKSKKKNMVAELTNLENYCCWKPNTETGWIATSFLLWSD